MKLEVVGLEGLPEIRPGDDLSALIHDAASRGEVNLNDGDIVVVAQKVVSKAEGRLRDLTTVEVGEVAHRISAGSRHDPRVVQIVLDESVRVVSSTPDLIVETRHGFVCANAGVDRSNVPGSDCVSLLPKDCDASARTLRDELAKRTGLMLGVIITDSFGRQGRAGQTNVALGIAGVPALIDYRGQIDDVGKELNSSILAVSDELAAAAELVMGKTSRVPVAIVRGYHPKAPEGSAAELLVTQESYSEAHPPRPRPPRPKPPTGE